MFAQKTAPDRLLGSLDEHAVAAQSSRLNTDDRVKVYQTLVKAKPLELHYRNLLASAFIQKTRETMDYNYLNKSSEILDQVFGQDPTNHEAERLRSEIALERHEFSWVADHSRRLLQEFPKDAWHWGTLGDASMELGKYDEAAEAYQKMVEIRPDLSSYNRAAYFRFIAGDTAGAIDMTKRAVSSGSDAAENISWCLVDLGNYYFKAGQLGEANSSYLEALRLFPGYPSALAAMGKLQAASGQAGPAIDLYKRAQAATPFPDYAAALYDLYLQQGNIKAAEQEMALVDAIDTLGRAAAEKVNRNLAMIYADHDRKLDRALELAQAEIKIRQDVYTWDALAWTLYKSGQFAEAEKAMNSALKMRTAEPMFLYHAGLIAKANHKNTEAAELLKKSLSLNPGFDFAQAKVAKKALQELQS